MKKIYLVLLIVLMFTGISYAMPVNDQEAWIGAYFFKEMLPADKFYPYVDIRNDNYLYNSDGNVIRNIMSDYILFLELPVNKKITSITQDLNNVVNIDRLVNGIDKTTFEQYIMQFKIMLLLKKEIQDRNQYLKSYLGMSAYDKFLYRFYHFKLMKVETYILNNAQSLNYSNSPAYSEKIKKIEQELHGILFDKKVQEVGELRDSIKFMNYINSMIPAYPEQLSTKTNLPLVSVGIQNMDMKLKAALMAELSNQIRFGYAQRVILLENRVNKNYLDNMNEHLNLYTELHLEQMQQKYKKLYGNTYNLSNFTPTNLTPILKNLIKI